MQKYGKKRFFLLNKSQKLYINSKEKMGLIRDTLENTRQIASHIIFVGTKGHKVKIRVNPI